MNDETEVLILRPKKLSVLGMLVISGSFVATGIWLGLQGKWMGYFCAAFFGLGVLVAVVQLLPGSTYLRVSSDGLSIVSLFRMTTIPWDIIDEFFVVTLYQSGLPIRKMVGFNFVESYDRAHGARRFATAIAGCEGALPDTYGMSAEDLADKLNQCLRAFRQPQTSGDDENRLADDAAIRS